MAVTDGDVVKVVVEIEAPATVIAQNVYYWQLSDPTPDNPTNTQIMNALDTRLSAMIGEIQSSTSNEYEYEDFTVSRVQWDGSKWETVEDLGVQDLSIVGLSANDAVPHGVAATVTAYTSRPQTRARKFLPGLVENNFLDSTLSGTLLAALAGFITDWLTDQVVVGSADLIPAVVGQSGPSAGLVYLLASAAANGIAGYQRRRKPGVGA